MTDEHDAHGEIHLPPNSFVPISTALALACTFVGFLVTPLMWIAGLVWLVISLVVWAKAARAEYLELPETLPH